MGFESFPFTLEASLYPRGPSRALIKGLFRKDHYVSSDLYSTLPVDRSFNGL